MKRTLDLVVIGGGSGGLQAAYEAAATYKRRVAVVDTQRFHGPPNFAALGGTCVNVGCVPKKLLVIGANYREAMRDATGFGFSSAAVQSDWKTLMHAKDAAIREINESYGKMFDDVEGMEFIEGWGSFKDANTIVVRRGADVQSEVIATLETKYTLIATGSWPFTPPMEGMDLCISSNEAFYLPECPRRTLVIGGGYIAVEFAGIFNAFKPADGFVTISYRGELFLRGFDKVLCEELASQMKVNGVRLEFGDTPVKVERNCDKSLRVTFKSGKTEDYDCVMAATGRRPRSQALNLSAAGVALGKDDAVTVDEFSRTNIPGIFAIGDVTNRVMLTPVAIHEADCVVATMFGSARKPDHNCIPSAVFSIPPIGTVGLTEDVAATKYSTVAVYSTSFLPLMHQLTRASHKRVVVRIIADNDTGRVVGVHMLGAEAPEVIQAVGIAVKMGATVKNFFDTMCVHPTAAEELCSERKPEYYYVNGQKKDTL